MTDTSVTPSDVFLFDRARLSQRHSTWTVAGAGAVTLGVLVGSWLIDHRLSGPSIAALDAGTARLTAAFHTPPAASLPDLAVPAPRAADTGAVAVTTAPAIPPLALTPPKVEAALLDSASVNGRVPLALADSAPLPPRFVAPPPGSTEPAAPTPGPAIALLVPLPEAPHDTAPVPDAPIPASVPPAVPPPQGAAAAQVTTTLQVTTPPQGAAVPLPAPRPDFRFAAPEPSPRAPRRQLARNTDTAPAPVAPGIPADNRSFLDRFFGALKPSNGPTLAYASPEDGLFGRSAAVPSGAGYSRTPYTAVYDISAHTVFMPDGSKLEAHSGLGRMLDDPRHVAARNVGPTPPHLYDLTLRESLFHGVQALRLTPVGGGGVYGRDGLLAHTFMLGPNGDSNGCVSFRDYAAFLRAYQSGQVKRLVVVAGG